jgi:hypothetical protein
MNFNKSLIPILFLIPFSACGKPQVVSVAQDFQPYVQKFQQVAQQQGKPVQITNLVVKFGPMENQYERGICEIDGDNPPTITIDQAAWEQMSDDEREPLVFHELGHCVLMRAHRPDMMGAGVPASIMNPYTLAGWTYDEYKTYYMKELFSVEDTL